jgi:hypothetical protein
METEDTLRQADIYMFDIFKELTFDLQIKGIAEVFINYSGHVNTMSIRIFAGKWEHDSEIDQIKNISIDHINFINRERLKAILEYLQNCIICNQVLIPKTEVTKFY